MDCGIVVSVRVPVAVVVASSSLCLSFFSDGILPWTSEHHVFTVVMLVKK